MKPSKTPHHVLYQHCRFPNQVGTKYCFSFSKKHQLDYFSLLQGCIHQMLVTTGKTFNSQQKLFRYLITQLQCKQTKCQNLKTQFPKDLIYGSANNKRIFSKLNVHKTFRRRPAVTAVIFPENSHSLDTLNRVTEHYERYRKLILKWFLDTMNAINLVIFFLFKKL